jgi:hypothetical protein
MTKNQKLPPLEDEFSTLTHVLNPAHACRAWLWEIKKEDCWRQGHGKIYASTRHLALVKKIFAIGAWLLLLIPCTYVVCAIQVMLAATDTDILCL